jgi:hypothetical protein
VLILKSHVIPTFERISPFDGIVRAQPSIQVSIDQLQGVIPRHCSQLADAIPRESSEVATPSPTGTRSRIRSRSARARSSTEGPLTEPDFDVRDRTATSDRRLVVPDRCPSAFICTPPGASQSQPRGQSRLVQRLGSLRSDDGLGVRESSNQRRLRTIGIVDPGPRPQPNGHRRQPMEEPPPLPEQPRPRSEPQEWPTPTAADQGPPIGSPRG